MPFGHYQLFTFSLASEAVLPDNRIILAPHFRSCPPLPFPPCVLEQVMGAVFARLSEQAFTGTKGYNPPLRGSSVKDITLENERQYDLFTKTDTELEHQAHCWEGVN